jgi:hypothetical protein
MMVGGGIGSMLSDITSGGNSSGAGVLRSRRIEQRP